ncbi:hypothetical protein [Nocardiopsis sp. NPDC057823]|uniref:hypothetical protein n=1 Tax=Nocardiopsis sp. NPDC057823 TaxID=3346256 RepID=UPI0036705437
MNTNEILSALLRTYATGRALGLAPEMAIDAAMLAACHEARAITVPDTLAALFEDDQDRDGESQ